MCHVHLDNRSSALGNEAKEIRNRIQTFSGSHSDCNSGFHLREQFDTIRRYRLFEPSGVKRFKRASNLDRGLNPETSIVLRTNSVWLLRDA